MQSHYFTYFSFLSFLHILACALYLGHYLVQEDIGSYVENS